jgi:hypothetical protein
MLSFDMSSSLALSALPQLLPTFSTDSDLRTHSNACNPIRFMRLLHGSLDTSGWGYRGPDTQAQHPRVSFRVEAFRRRYIVTSLRHYIITSPSQRRLASPIAPTTTRNR